MSQQSAVVYPPPTQSYPPLGQGGYPQGPYVVAPPPSGYPTKDGYGYGYPQQAAAPPETRSKGDGFWKGCCAALCCCCVLDMCT
ncbi:cysteine-rich and transmembrane domain-containing protein WIH1-like isoform X2 [Macadamia integrifolia]|uniref:cysteine-rich and transmembrane domain-containing protein WIH1-like isoform X2 n=1 Tax=Macadamia integrifolia TaxID=60698 RepID=UPI001C4EB1EA|nr:cysteine-rich and transmembrane domain-containing protein WIH1-like isoform X2 [Macadamia integrifolia]